MMEVMNKMPDCANIAATLMEHLVTHDWHGRVIHKVVADGEMEKVSAI